jgi:hypothetical protein
LEKALYKYKLLLLLLLLPTSFSISFGVKLVQFDWIVRFGAVLLPRLVPFLQVAQPSLAT